MKQFLKFIAYLQVIVNHSFFQNIIGVIFFRNEDLYANDL